MFLFIAFMIQGVDFCAWRWAARLVLDGEKTSVSFIEENFIGGNRGNRAEAGSEESP